VPVIAVRWWVRRGIWGGGAVKKIFFLYKGSVVRASARQPVTAVI